MYAHPDWHELVHFKFDCVIVWGNTLKALLAKLVKKDQKLAFLTEQAIKAAEEITFKKRSKVKARKKRGTKQ